jgi:NTP pyrophosphatase (non-canonical NTP hydrolase)
MITDRQREVLVITQEEAAEVIQEISKVFRFGIDDNHRDGMTHRKRLEAEIGDLLCMIDLMVDNRLIDPTAVELARQAKVTKLRRYSQIYT